MLAELAAHCLKGHSEETSLFLWLLRHRESQSPGTWRDRKADILFCELGDLLRRKRHCFSPKAKVQAQSLTQTQGPFTSSSLHLLSSQAVHSSVLPDPVGLNGGQVLSILPLPCPQASPQFLSLSTRAGSSSSPPLSWALTPETS